MKRFSISYKWALVIGIIVLTVLVVGLVINKLFFYQYYLNKEKEEILTFAEAVDESYGTAEMDTVIDRFTLKKQASVMILDSDNVTRNFSFGMFNSGSIKGRQAFRNSAIRVPEAFKETIAEDSYAFFEINHELANGNLLVLGYELTETDMLLIMLPFEAIDETADISMMFNFYVSLILLVFAMLIVLFISKRMTKPIIELSDMTLKISNLDFSESFHSDTGDEIGDLGRNINVMSQALEKTLVDLKIANEQLLLDIEEKEKHVKMRKSLIANISHELKTPIALVMSYTEGLRDNFELDEEKKNYYLDVISKESSHMDQLVRDLLNLSELEYDAFRLNKKKMDLSSLVDEIMDRYILMISKKKLTIEIDKEDILMLTADKKRLEQAVANLIINALEHTPNEGTISIRAYEDEMMHFEISNTGKHIDEDLIENIWNSFYKTEDNQDRRIGGSGIGLSIVRAVVEKHGGSYGVSNVENGVKFRISLEKNI